MAAFIVISTDERLHYLLDGIEKYRPINPCVNTYISIGKINQKEKDSFTYEYNIHGEGIKEEDAKSLGYIVANQLAAFRNKYTIDKERVLNVFVLDNSLCDEEYKTTQSWCDQIEEIYGGGRGTDTSFRLFRVCFSYDIQNPTDIKKQTDKQILRTLFESYKSSDNGLLERYLFYIDNQKCDNAAICLNKEAHDLMMSRFLLDFMMLVSCENDSYSVINAINKSNSKCFSIGFAESMYFFPDVERYYLHADLRELYHLFLKTEDEAISIEDKKAMNVDTYPLGLYSRLNRLEHIYKDVPFNENINSYSNSADKRIDDYVVSLKDYLIAERKKEIEDYMYSPIVLSKKKEIEDIQYILDGNDESVVTMSEEEKRMYIDKIKETQVEYENLIASFKPQCPEYVDRTYIFMQSMLSDNTLDILENQYKEIINFILSRSFIDYLNAQLKEKTKVDKTEEISVDFSNNDKKNIGCLSKLFFWKKSKEQYLYKEKESSIVDNIESIDYFQIIISIKELLDLKDQFKKFEKHVKEIENKYKDEKLICDSFRLTDHASHYYHLIDINKLKECHNLDYIQRQDSNLSEWQTFKNRTEYNFVSLTIEKVKSYVKNKFSFIDWTNPFEFVPHLSSNNMHLICNGLQKRSAPFVNYNINSESQVNSIIKALYSDRVEFEREFDDMKNKIDNGSSIISYMSSHIASKICMMQFLSIDQSVIDGLVDLQFEGEFNYNLYLKRI